MHSTQSRLLSQFIFCLFSFCAANIAISAVSQQNTLNVLLIEMRRCDQIKGQTVMIDSYLYSNGDGIAFMQASPTAYCQIQIQPAGQTHLTTCDYTKADLASFFDTKLDQKIQNFDFKKDSLVEMQGLLKPIVDCYKKAKGGSTEITSPIEAAPVTIQKPANNETSMINNEPAKKVEQQNSSDQYDYGKLLQ